MILFNSSDFSQWYLSQRLQKQWRGDPSQQAGFGDSSLLYLV